MTVTLKHPSPESQESLYSPVLTVEVILESMHVSNTALVDVVLSHGRHQPEVVCVKTNAMSPTHELSSETVVPGNQIVSFQFQSFIFRPQEYIDEHQNPLP